MPHQTIPLQITLIRPPSGVLFSLQDKNKQLSQQTLSTGDDITFQLSVDVDDSGRIQGKFALGPPARRFFYICSGTYAGQTEALWSRRAKIPLAGLTSSHPQEAIIEGMAKDGGPVCATVPFVVSWRMHRNM
jgi:hypothetical protein